MNQKLGTHNHLEALIHAVRRRLIWNATVVHLSRTLVRERHCRSVRESATLRVSLDARNGGTVVKKMDVAQSRLHSLDIGARSTLSDSHYECSVAAPYRLDLTVSVLRRVSTNVVDVLTPEGQYVRALGGSREPVIVRVAQVHPKALTITLGGDEGEHRRLLAVVRA